MPLTVLIKDIVLAMEMEAPETSTLLDLDTGKVKFVSDYLRRQAERAEDGTEEPDLPDWQKPEWEIAKRLVSAPDSFVRLPDRFDIHEWSIMEDFSRRFPSDAISSQLMDAIHGSGAFRHFKSTLRRLRLEQAWADFYNAALRQIAIDWCEENEIPYA